MATKREFKDAAYGHVARLGKATSSPKRLELLDLLAQGPRSVEALAEETAQTVANVSQHLQVLRGARLVDSERDGLYTKYRLADENVARFLFALHQLAEAQLEELEQVTRSFLTERGALEAIDHDSLMQRLRSGDVTLLDVRPAEEFRAGHIPGALNVPIADLTARLAELPKYRDVVAYCRGPYCVMAIEAVELLRKKGFRAQRMEQGVVEWRARGLPVERSVVAER